MIFKVVFLILELKLTMNKLFCWENRCPHWAGELCPGYSFNYGRPM